MIGRVCIACVIDTGDESDESVDMLDNTICMANAVGTKQRHETHSTHRERETQ